jgi:hypothetical protein
MPDVPQEGMGLPMQTTQMIYGPACLFIGVLLGAWLSWRASRGQSPLPRIPEGFVPWSKSIEPEKPEKPARKVTF